jgi:hypothetical protein
MERVKTLQKFSRAITPSNNTDECRIPAWHMHNPYCTVEPNANMAACMVVTAQSSSLSICEVYFVAVQIHLLHVLHKQNRTKYRVHPSEARQFKSRLTKQWKTQHTYNPVWRHFYSKEYGPQYQWKQGTLWVRELEGSSAQRKKNCKDFWSWRLDTKFLHSWGIIEWTLDSLTVSLPSGLTRNY